VSTKVRQEILLNCATGWSEKHKTQ